MPNDRHKKPNEAPGAGQLYSELWKEAAGAWDAALRDPNVLAALAAANAQQVAVAARVREAVSEALRAMNVASRDDVAALSARIDALEAKIDRLAAAPEPKAAGRPRSGRR